MAYGGLNTGGGASTYDLDRLAASIISGQVSAPLTTADGIGIATQGGEEIGVWYSRSAELQEIYAAIQLLAAGIISGQVSTPLAAANGVGICNHSGTGIAAVRNLNYF